MGEVIWGEGHRRRWGRTWQRVKTKRKKNPIKRRREEKRESSSQSTKNDVQVASQSQP